MLFPIFFGSSSKRNHFIGTLISFITFEIWNPSEKMEPKRVLKWNPLGSIKFYNILIMSKLGRWL